MKHDDTSALLPYPKAMKLGAGIHQSCFTRLDDSVSQLRNVRNRVSGLADMLAGSVPEAGCAADGKSAGGGRFDQIDYSAEEISSLCAEIEACLARIENRL